MGKLHPVRPAGLVREIEPEPLALLEIDAPVREGPHPELRPLEVGKDPDGPARVLLDLAE